MTFIALDVQKNFLIQQQSTLQYKEMIASNNYENVTASLATLSESGASMDSAPAKKLAYYQQLYEQQQSSIESQLKVIQNQIDSFQKTVDTNIKSECKLSISA